MRQVVTNKVHTNGWTDGTERTEFIGIDVHMLFYINFLLFRYDFCESLRYKKNVGLRNKCSTHMVQ